MTEYYVAEFDGLNKYAAEIDSHNREYEVRARFDDHDLGIKGQNRIAGEQADLVEALGEFSDSLPYEQLAHDYSETETQLEKAMIDLEEDFEIKKLATLALSNRLSQDMPLIAETVESSAAIRQAELEKSGLEATATTLALQERLGELSLVYETAGQAWPLPRALPVEDSFIKSISEGEGELQPPTRQIVTEEPMIGNTVFQEPTIVERNGANRRAYPEGVIREAPQASKEMAAYFLARIGETVTPDELAEHLYGFSDEVGERTKRRGRIMTMLGPKVQGKRMSRLLNPHGYRLQYGWLKQTVPGKGITKSRVYRAGPDGEQELPEFEEVR